jgi:hypothetical protein
VTDVHVTPTVRSCDSDVAADFDRGRDHLGFAIGSRAPTIVITAMGDRRPARKIARSHAITPKSTRQRRDDYQ